MTNQNKSAQARQRRRSSDGRFADEDKQDSLPSDTKIQQVASLLTDDTEPDFNQLLTATGAFDDPYEARHIEFDMPDGSTLNGYALDDGRIDRNKVPAGWHAYSMNYREAEAVTVSCFAERMENIRRLSTYDSDALSTGLYSPRSKGILSEYSDCPSQTMV